MDPVMTLRGEVEVVQPTRLQRVVASRMAEAHRTVPDFILNAEVDATAVTALRAELKLAGAGPPPTINDLVVRACGRALIRHPRVNAAYRDGTFELYDRVNVGVVVATDTGVLVPTIFDADQKSLAEVASATRDLSERARRGGLMLDELDGGTFTVSNLGMFGITSFVPIINAPQAGILGVGAVVERERRQVMALTFVGDHRIVNGADGARFLNDIGFELAHAEELR